VFPYRDENPTLLRPLVTVAIIGLNVLVWIVVQGVGTGDAMVASVCRLGLTPGELLGTVPPASASSWRRGTSAPSSRARTTTPC
jgi:membrane associated rhomboid family serine protease